MSVEMKRRTPVLFRASRMAINMVTKSVRCDMNQICMIAVIISLVIWLMTVGTLWGLKQ